MKKAREGIHITEAVDELPYAAFLQELARVLINLIV